MIKLHKDINNIFKKYENAGFETYVVGTCICEFLIGRTPFAWEIAVSCNPEELKNVCPDGVSLIGDMKNLYFEFGESEKQVLVVTAYDGSIEEYLSRQDFNINAMADNPSRKFVDPYNARKDIKDKIIKTVAEPKEFYKNNPIFLMETIRFAAEYGFDIQKKTYDGMIDTAHCLQMCSIDERREIFEAIIVAPYAGNGLRMLAGADLMPAIIGKLATSLNRRQISQFGILCENIDKTHRVLLRRLGLFYTALEGKKAEAAMRMLEYDYKTQRNLKDALYIMEKMHFIRSTVELKDFLVEIGIERYDYIHNLSKAQRIVYDLPDSKIIGRNEYMKNIYDNNEPIFVNDLAVTAEHLIKEGIAPEKTEDILVMLTDVVHRRPNENTEKHLIRIAKKFDKNKFAAKTRKVKWLR